MKENNIRLRPDRLNFPLEQCTAGRLSSAVFILYGDIPDDVEDMVVKIGRTPDPTTHQPREDFTAAASEIAGEPRKFRCYLAPFYFPDAAEGLKYSVVGLDAHGNTRWLGTGGLDVLENPANGSGETPELIPNDTYIRNPVTGLYHKLTAAVNELGEIVIDCAPEGIQR